MRLLCLGGPKHGEYVDVVDPYRGLFVPIVDRSSWLASGMDEGTSINLRFAYYRMEKFALTGGFTAPVFVLDSIAQADMIRHLIPLIFKPEFVATGV